MMNFNFFTPRTSVVKEQWNYSYSSSHNGIETKQIGQWREELKKLKGQRKADFSKKNVMFECQLTYDSSESGKQREIIKKFVCRNSQVVGGDEQSVINFIQDCGDEQIANFIKLELQDMIQINHEILKLDKKLFALGECKYAIKWGKSSEGKVYCEIKLDVASIEINNVLYRIRLKSEKDLAHPRLTDPNDLALKEEIENKSESNFSDTLKKFTYQKGLEKMLGKFEIPDDSEFDEENEISNEHKSSSFEKRSSSVSKLVFQANDSKKGKFQYIIRCQAKVELNVNDNLIVTPKVSQLKMQGYTNEIIHVNVKESKSDCVIS